MVEYLEQDIILPVTSTQGRLDWWLWLTKRLHCMTEFSEQLRTGALSSRRLR